MDEQIPFTDWVENGPMNNHMYRKSGVLDENYSEEIDTESLTSFTYTYPVDQVRIRDLVQLYTTHGYKRI